MLKKYKKMIMALVCMIAIMAQAMPAYAAVNNFCGCDYPKTNTTMSKDAYYSTNGTFHKVSWKATTKCSNCGYEVTEYLYTNEDCKWTTNYTDLGHQGESHRYRLTCGTCHGTYDVSLYCEADWTGRHNTPW